LTGTPVRGKRTENEQTKAPVTAKTSFLEVLSGRTTQKGNFAFRNFGRGWQRQKKVRRRNPSARRALFPGDEVVGVVHVAQEKAEKRGQESVPKDGLPRKMKKKKPH